LKKLNKLTRGSFQPLPPYDRSLKTVDAYSFPRIPSCQDFRLSSECSYIYPFPHRSRSALPSAPSSSRPVRAFGALP